MRKSRYAPVLTAFLLVLGLAVILPLSALAADYGVTTSSGVRVRQSASSNAGYWFKLPEGYVCLYTDYVSNDEGDWYYVTVENPESTDGRTYTGYVLADLFRPMTTEERQEWEKNPSSGKTIPIWDNSTATGRVTNGEVNLRQGPSLRGRSLMKLNRGTLVQLLSIPDPLDPDPWYHVSYDRVTGYIQGPFIQVLTYGNLQTTAAPTATAQGVTPSPTQGQTLTYVRLILTSAHLRSTPGGVVWEEWEDTGGLLPVWNGGEQVSAGGFMWYPVIYKSRNVYVRSDCVEPVYTFSGGIITPSPTPRQILGYVIINAKNVNLRLQPGGGVITSLAKGTILPYVAGPVEAQGYSWYSVESGNIRGWVRADYADKYGGEITAAPATPTPSPTPTSSSGVINEYTSNFGYVRTIRAGVNVRDKANGSRKGSVGIGLVFPMSNLPENRGGYDWYPVYIPQQGMYGYLRGDCVEVLTADEAMAYLKEIGALVTPSPTPIHSNNHYVQVILNNAPLRNGPSPDAGVVRELPANTVLAFRQILSSGGAVWYQVIYENEYCYLLSTNLVEMTDAEYQAYLLANPGKTPQKEVYAGFVRTIKNGINVRQTPGSKVIMGRVNSGVVMPFTLKTTYGGYTWYYTQTGVGMGYLRSDCVVEVTSTGDPTPTPNPEATKTAGQAKKEASYTTLKKGSTGSAVRNLVDELIRQGYYRGTSTSSYTTQVEEAVKAFQRVKNLYADGIANSATQHALFGTVPVGYGDTSDLSMTLYPAEKIDWYNGGIQELIPRGSDFKVYDVKTGIVWWAHRWAGGKHADIETKTAADTARLCQIYGVSDASQINSKDHWQRRPCLITVGSRTFACSLYGVPHNEEGDTIPDNNMVGQICLHFTNSRTHDSDRVDTYHQEAIEYAWQNAPNGHK